MMLDWWNVYAFFFVQEIWGEDNQKKFQLFVWMNSILMPQQGVLPTSEIRFASWAEDYHRSTTN